MSASQDIEMERIRNELQCLLAAEGFVSEPVGGCPAGADVDPEQVARIVKDVVGKLQQRGID
jgi:hypothetical protein